jgi:hypothetical protein
MSNYTKQISWSGKDALSDSDPEKVISGGDFDTEFSAVQTAINSKIDGGTITNFTSTGIDDNATSTAITIDASENVHLNTASPKLVVGTTAVSTGNCELNIGQDRTGDGYSFIDLIGDTTYSDFGTRLIRNNNGLNANSTLQHRGTGELQITATEAAPIVFRSNNSERMRILSGGGLTFNGDTAAANALDDYEEGTWTPAFTASGGSAGSVAYNTQKGYYTKIGRLVSCQFMLDLTNVGSWSAEVRLTGLPFDPADTFPAAGSVSLHRVDVPNEASGHDVYVNPGVTYFRFYYTQDNGARTFVQVSQCQNTAKFNGIISYIV